ncbi:lipase [Staphylococcus capitis]|uniref:YSIRK-targeted triacylglycerol lipase n=1 Tax=Staphylococcus capitis TaxID=29388 RepID=UPI000D1B3267|nr:YSIRK-type signal peptide-containing protein [Staphylococcus capitis]PTG36014.1 lipase [Staphylococcus capitis]PTH09177.1 lipase [Staphylococcus capitis]RIM49968.1 YSIRK-type signal peptide-containing protein [Staphylococcus capitis]
MKNYNEKKRFSIRKYAVGVVSIVTGITIFIGGQQAHAAEETNQQINTPSHSNETTQTAQKNLKENESRPSESELPSSKTSQPQQSESTQHSQPQQTESTQFTQAQQTNPTQHPQDKENSQNQSLESTKEATNHNDTPDTSEAIDTKKEESDNQDVLPSKKTQDSEKTSDSTSTQDRVASTDNKQYESESKPTETQSTETTQENNKVTQSKSSDNPSESQESTKSQGQQELQDKTDSQDPQESKDKSSTHDTTYSKESKQNSSSSQPQETTQESRNNKDETDNDNPQSKGAHQSSQNTQLRSTENNDDPKDSTQLKSSNKEQDTREQNNEKEVDQPTKKTPSMKQENKNTTKQSVKTDKTERPTSTEPKTLQSHQPNKLSKQTLQAQYKNQYPVVFVHGFAGLVGEDAFTLYPNYWGGGKYNIKSELTKQGYRVHEANIGAFSSNYDRAVDLYYYIKGGRVDYGAAHAAKYGHHRYGRTYEGIMPDWAPGKKIHLVGHSMGGQTIRLMEHFLRNGNQEEIDYQRQHGGTVSDLFKGGKDNMISTITTVGTPHNGTPAADKLGTRKIVKDAMNRIGRLSGSRLLDLNSGFSQWGFKQKPNESYIEYAERVANSRIWDTEDQAINDLTTAGAEKLNKMTNLNPNIVYTTYTGAATHTGPLGFQIPDVRQLFAMDITSRIIGRDKNKNVRVNDGLVPVSSSIYPTAQAFKKVGFLNPATSKGVWQVRPVQNGWDHADLIGLDLPDFKRTGAELGKYYLGMINNMMRVEELDGLTKK